MEKRNKRYLPEKSAEAPAPATARPTMSIGELTAVAHMIEPTAGAMSETDI